MNKSILDLNNRAVRFSFVLITILTIVLIIVHLYDIQVRRNWENYSDYGLSFLYPQSWEYDDSWFSENNVGNIHQFRFYENIPEEGYGGEISVSSYDRMQVRIEKDYVPLSGMQDKLLSYFKEYYSYRDENLLVEKKLGNRRYLEYKVEVDDIYQDFMSLYIDLPEQNGVLEFYFPDVPAKMDSSLSDLIKKELNYVLSSLELSNYDWVVETPLIENSNDLDITGWNEYVGKNFSIKYPTDWKISEKQDLDYADLINVTLEPIFADTHLGEYKTSIIIGTGAIFSTSGAICANHGYNSCLSIGSASVKIMEKTYSSHIIDKLQREAGNTYFYDSFYVSRIMPNRISKDPYLAITAIFKNQLQGQEIANILSTMQNSN